MLRQGADMLSYDAVSVLCRTSKIIFKYLIDLLILQMLYRHCFCPCWVSPSCSCSCVSWRCITVCTVKSGWFLFALYCHCGVHRWL